MINMNKYSTGRTGGKGESSEDRNGGKDSFSIGHSNRENKTIKGKQTNKIVFTVKHARLVVSFETKQQIMKRHEKYK